MRLCMPQRRDARVVDWGGLENRCLLARTGGSNPSLSAEAMNASRAKGVAGSVFME